MAPPSSGCESVTLLGTGCWSGFCHCCPIGSKARGRRYVYRSTLAENASRAGGPDDSFVTKKFVAPRLNALYKEGLPKRAPLSPFPACCPCPKRTDLKSILLIGSGPIIIGQACEFDYSGVQACKALREEGYRVILINSNPATIMTDPEFADRTYIEPITPEIVEKIIAREKPDAASLPTLGGQDRAQHRDGAL